MQRMKKWTVLSFVIAVALMTTVVQADAITILNASFESPAITSAWSNAGTDHWNATGTNSGLINNSLSLPVDGVTGNQYAYLYALNSSVLGDLWQVGPLVEVGKSYTLSADIVGMAGFAGTSSGATMEMRVGYTTDGLTFTTLADTEILYDDVYDSGLTNQVMANFTCSTLAIPEGSPTENANIVVWFGMTSASGKTNFGIDNVQLSSTASAVPEPSTVMGLACILLSGFFLRKRVSYYR